MNARIVGWAFLAALVALHATVSWLSPVQSDDWDRLIWAARHADDPVWLANFVKNHYTFSDAMRYVVANHTFVHTIVTPLAGAALIVGMFVVATKRRPRMDWRDVTGLVILTGLLWIATPRAGLVFFHRPYVATWLYGTAMLVWFVVPFRCAIAPPRWLVPLVVLAGFLAASATRQFGVVAVVIVAYALAKTQPRPVWMWIALVAVVAGAYLGFRDEPFDYRGYRPGFELSLTALNLPIFEGGELVTFVMGLAMGKLVVGTLWPHHAGDHAPDARETLRWLGTWGGYIVIALLGPRYSEATLFPAAVILCIGAYPHVTWVMTSRPLRLVVIAIAIGINVIAWAHALATYVPLSSEYRDRRAILAAAPKGSVATVKTYQQIRPSFWAFGEDWSDAARRELVAAELFRLRDIEVSPPFRRMESNPKLAITLEVEGVTPEQLRAAGAPDVWAGTLRTARIQFEGVITELRRTIPTAFSARLVTPMSLEVLAGRPLLVAAYDRGELVNPRVQRRNPDDNSRQGVQVRPRSFATAFPEAYAVVGPRTEKITFKRDYRVLVLTSELHAVVACDPRRCFLVDAFIPSF